MTLGRRNLFVKALRLFRVERKRKLRRPVQLVTCSAIALSRSRAPGRPRAISAACAAILLATIAFADVILVRQAQMLGRSDVAQEVRACLRRDRAADGEVIWS